jgi:hypothetical protein
MVQKGNSLLDASDLEGSREAFEEAADITPDHPGALLA